MIYKLLSLLFLCATCVSVFGQELQSPQINQNAIIANPGLAGSKGNTRICASIGGVSRNIFPTNNTTNINKSTYYNSTISIDGLVFKSSIGVGMYIQHNSYVEKYYHIHELSPNNYSYDKTTNDVTLNTTTVGFIISPKFYLKTKKGSSISPALGFGFRNSNLNHDYYYNSSFFTNDTTSSYNYNKTEFCLSNIDLGLLYNSKNGYVGIKNTLLNNLNKSYILIATIIAARTFYYNGDEESNFSFTPQLYASLPLINSPSYSDGTEQYKPSYKPFGVLTGTNFSLNLDFRYKKLIIGQYIYVGNLQYLTTGLNVGYQFERMRFMLNACPKFDLLEYSIPGEIHLSVNIVLKNKNNDL
jgi:hypothetical protein